MSGETKTKHKHDKTTIILHCGATQACPWVTRPSTNQDKEHLPVRPSCPHFPPLSSFGLTLSGCFAVPWPISRISLLALFPEPVHFFYVFCPTVVVGQVSRTTSILFQILPFGIPGLFCDHLCFSRRWLPRQLEPFKKNTDSVLPPASASSQICTQALRQSSNAFFVPLSILVGALSRKER